MRTFLSIILLAGLIIQNNSLHSLKQTTTTAKPKLCRNYIGMFVSMDDMNKIFEKVSSQLTKYNVPAIDATAAAGVDAEKMKKCFGYDIVKTISSILPHIDSIGHRILHADNQFINYIISQHDIPHDLKGKIILFSIQLAQNGDNFGTSILQLYYDIVEKCFF